MGVKPCCNGKDDLWGTHFPLSKTCSWEDRSMEGETTSWNAVFSKNKNKKLALLRLQWPPYKILALALPCHIRPCGLVAIYLLRGIWHYISSWLFKHTELTNPSYSIQKQQVRLLLDSSQPKKSGFPSKMPFALHVRRICFLHPPRTTQRHCLSKSSILSQWNIHAHLSWSS